MHNTELQGGPLDGTIIKDVRDTSRRVVFPVPNPEAYDNDAIVEGRVQWRVDADGHCELVKFDEATQEWVVLPHFLSTTYQRTDETTCDGLAVFRLMRE